MFVINTLACEACSRLRCGCFGTNAEQLLINAAKVRDYQGVSDALELGACLETVDAGAFRLMCTS